MKRKGLLLLTSIICLLSLSAGCSTTKTASSPAVSVSPATNSATPSDSSQKVFTLSELSKYNGRNGASAYVAVNGVVYDVTNDKNWVNGTHNGHSAGQDLTQAIKQSPHGASALSGLPVVGKLQ